MSQRFRNYLDNMVIFSLSSKGYKLIFGHNNCSIINETTMLKRLNKIFVILLFVLISMMLGYVLRVHHEGKIRKTYQSQAEKELATLEEEFNSAIKKHRKFYIFNRRFEVYPLRESDRTFFYYREVKDADLVDREVKVTKSMENNGKK